MRTEFSRVIGYIYGEKFTNNSTPKINIIAEIDRKHLQLRKYTSIASIFIRFKKSRNY